MIIVDNALEAAIAEGRRIGVGIVGAGFSGRLVAYHLIKHCPGIAVVAISNRSVDAARTALTEAGIEDIAHAKTQQDMSNAHQARRTAVTQDHRLLCDSDHIDVIVEATGTIEFGCRVVLDAISGRKHVVLLNVELDATLGPLLKKRAEESGCVYTNTDGDEPGVAMNLLRYVKSIGLEPVVAGNLKGFYDKYRNPTTQQGFAEKHGQKAKAVASFADGTKLSMELTVLANATGMSVGQTGMYGPKLDSVYDAAEFYSSKLPENAGIVDFLQGAQPGNGAFVLGHTDDRKVQSYLEYLKMGPGPLYVFYTPFHLPQLEISNTIARAALLKDATVAPKGAPVCESIAYAKRDLSKGDTLDGLGGFDSYALIQDFKSSLRDNALPIGISEGCRVRRSIQKDKVITFDDIDLPSERLCDELHHEQQRMGQ